MTPQTAVDPTGGPPRRYAEMEALSVFASPPEWLSAAADGGRVAAAVSDTVRALGTETHHVVGCRVEDLRLSGRRWEGRYELTLDGPDRRRQVMLAAVLSADERGPRPAVPPVPVDDPRWSIALTDLPLTLSHPAADRKLPALAALTDPGAARGWLERALGATYPGIRIDGCEPVVARYRPGQRCIVVCQLAHAAPADPSWPAIVVAKAYRKGRGAHEYGALQAAAAARMNDRDGFRFARPLAYVPEDDVAVQSHLPQDRSLVDLVRNAAAVDDPTPAATTALTSVADALADLHRSELRYGAVRSIEDEIASVRGAAGKLESLSPEMPAAVEPWLALVEQQARTVPAEPPAPSHGAFRPAQVRLDGDRVGLLDLDGFGQCEPAQDVGRFVAKLRLVALLAGDGLADRASVADALAATFLERYTAEAPVSMIRVTLWETLDLLKALLQSWSRARPAQIGPVLALLGDRAEALH